MANEIKAPGPGPGRTVYALIFNATSGYVWSTSGGTGAYEAFTSGNYQDYAVSLTERGISNLYFGNVPSAVPAGLLDVNAKQQLTGSPVQTDPNIAAGQIEWNGSKVLPLSDIPISGVVPQIRLQRGVAVSGFMFYLKSSADHVTPFTSGNGVSGQINRDGAGFVALQSGGQFVEQGLGFYSCNFTSGDLNGANIGLLITGTNVAGGTCDPLPLSLIMQRSSGG
jgi:hypothetical protein